MSDNVKDIVERLQLFAPHVTRPRVAQIMTEAADTIATLRKQLENARDALRDIEEVTARKQLPLTAQINARAIRALKGEK